MKKNAPLVCEQRIEDTSVQKDNTNIKSKAKTGDHNKAVRNYKLCPNKSTSSPQLF